MNFVEINSLSHYKIKKNDTPEPEIPADFSFKIRPAEKTDCQEIARLIQELAEYEKYPKAMEISVHDLERDGFRSVPPLFQVLVAEDSTITDQLVGYAMYYNSYSTWVGKTLSLEDIYVTPEVRHKKVGSALFRAVSKIALSTGCSRLSFQVLDWNPARKFYKAHGAVCMTDSEGWQLYRMTRDAMEALPI